MGRPTTAAVGKRAEELAREHLCEHGLRLVARNYRSRGGEIDLIMTDRDCLVFVEVRFRESDRFAPASHTVDIHKQRKLIRTAALYVSRHRRFALSVQRFDVVAVSGMKNAAIEWIRDAFRPLDSTL